ncbi:MAG: hypothetical protein IAE85_21190 [Anaerolinea sp.]|nr:hypothetical protein [Anaerolinea sp.]
MTSGIITPYSWMLGHGSRLARRGVAIWAALMILWALTSCTAMNNQQLHIRIDNATDTDITAFWLGAGSGAGGPGSRAYGAIDRGQITPYRSLKAQFGSYSNYNFITEEGKRFVGSTVANELIGQVALEPGYYTLVLTIVGDKAMVTIRPEETP